MQLHPLQIWDVILLWVLNGRAHGMDGSKMVKTAYHNKQAWSLYLIDRQGALKTVQVCLGSNYLLSTPDDVFI